MNNKLPMTLLAQIDDVAIFQTAAFSSDDIKINDVDLDNQQAAQQHKEQIHEQCNKQYHQQCQANYGELNLGLHVNDDPTSVLRNRMRLLSAINEQVVDNQDLSADSLPIKVLHWVNQVHGQQIHDIDATALTIEPLAADAMVSQQDGVGLAIMTADCVPIVLYQPATGQIAAIHAGWQGLACGVIQATAERFNDSGQVLAWIGVCISQDNYEVGPDVRDKLLQGCLTNKLLAAAMLEEFDQHYVVNVLDNATANNNGSNAQNLDKSAAKQSSCATANATKIKIDLPRLAADQLITAGITVSNPSSSACSYANDYYYSYRRQTHLQQPATGRMALIITRSASI